MFDPCILSWPRLPPALYEDYSSVESLCSNHLEQFIYQSFSLHIEAFGSCHIDEYYNKCLEICPGTLFLQRLGHLRSSQLTSNLSNKALGGYSWQ